MTGEADTFDELRPEDQGAIAIDPRLCGHCGLMVGEHFPIDQGDGPEHFCQPLDVVLHLRAAALQEAWERADPRDAWMHTGEPSPPDSVRNGPQAEPARQTNRPAQSTVDAFLYLVSLKDPDRLVAWLQARERDRPFLLKLLEAK